MSRRGENRTAHLFQEPSAFHRGTVARSLTEFKCARIVSQRTSKVQGPQLAQLGPTLLSLLLGLLWGPTCWDWGCNEGAATPRWGCICRPKTVRHWLNEWGPGCHCNAQGQLPLHSASDVEAAQLCTPRDEEKRRAIHSTIRLLLPAPGTDMEAIFVSVCSTRAV